MPNPSLAYLIIEDYYTISHAVSGTNLPFPSSLKDLKTTQNQTHFPGTMYQTNRSKITKNTSSSCWTILKLSLTQPLRLLPRVFLSGNLSKLQFMTHQSWYLLQWMDLILISISILKYLFFLNQQFIMWGVRAVRSSYFVTTYSQRQITWK